MGVSGAFLTDFVMIRLFGFAGSMSVWQLLSSDVTLKAAKYRCLKGHKSIPVKLYKSI